MLSVSNEIFSTIGPIIIGDSIRDQRFEEFKAVFNLLRLQGVERLVFNDEYMLQNLIKKV